MRPCSPCRSGISGALILGLQLAASAPPVWAGVDVDRLVFEAQLLTDTMSGPPIPHSPAAPQALAAPLTPAAAAQPASQLDAITAHNQRIAALVEDQGAFAAGLEQEYLDLGRRYQNLGRHDAAIEAFEDAEHVSRVNAGLVNPALFAIIEASIPSHLARGDQQEVARRQQYLYTLLRDHYGNGSAELVPLLKRLGDQETSNFLQGLRRGPQVRIAFGSHGNIDPRILSFGNLFRAQRHYSEAIGNLLQRQDFHVTTLLELEQKFVQTIYLGANREGLLNNPDFFFGKRRDTTGTRLRHSEMEGLSSSFINGRAAYQRMHAYAGIQRQSAAEQARILVAEADWHLLFNHHGKARRLYQDAWQLLQTAGVAHAVRAALLAPALPQQLPAFMALPHSRAHFGLAAETPLHWEGWVDLSFELSRYGKPRRLTILGSSAGTDKAVTARLRRLLMGSPFRPRIDAPDGPRQTHIYRLRYHYAQAPSVQCTADTLAQAALPCH